MGMIDSAEIMARCRAEWDYYAPRALKIRDKNGRIEPFIPNTAQQFIHSKIEEQRAIRGWVRALILKGRQQGASTYVEGRFYWKVSGQKGKVAYILTHEIAATEKIFGMAQRYHENCPSELRPSAQNNNAKELVFGKLDSAYEVATAGTKAVGRGGTVQYFHGSEVAFWPNAQDHMSGVGQSVPDLPDTEIILESTANGVGNLFHEMWQQAERGESDYIAIFVPWFIQAEYRREVPPGFVLDADEIEYATAHNLDLEQMAWRRYKIINTFSGDPLRFQQEYPATAAEAFVSVGTDSYIPASLGMRASKTKVTDAFGPLIIGVDPARSGLADKTKGDCTGMIRRRGRKSYKPERLRIGSTMELAGYIANVIQSEKPDRVFIDVGGLGAGVYDRLIELKFGKVVQAVNFGGEPLNRVKYFNKRAEMWGLTKEWLEQPPVELPDNNVLRADLMGPQYSYHSDGALKLEKKEDMKERGLKSPDLGDALALTFAYPVQSTEPEVANWRERLKHKARSAKGTSPMAA